MRTAKAAEIWVQGFTGEAGARRDGAINRDPRDACQDITET